MEARDRQRDAWLREVLGGPPARVVAASGDASFRRYFRVHVGTTSRILMDAPPPREDCRPFVQVTGLLADAGVNVPAILAADLERGFLLLSDLGDRLYLDVLDTRTSHALYGDALAALVRLQARGDPSALPAYDRRRLMDEMHLFPDWFLTRHLGVVPDERAIDVLADACEFLVRECLAQPRVLVHRDYHSRNLMHVPGNNPGVLDYQDAVLGPVAYDLVSLLRDVYVRWPEARVAGWIADYHRRACDAGLLQGADVPTLTRWFDLAGVQRHLKVAGIFARLWYRDGKDRYLPDIPLTLRYLLQVARRYRELADLVALLDGLDVVARNAAATAALAPAPAPP